MQPIHPNNRAIASLSVHLRHFLQSQTPRSHSDKQTHAHAHALTHSLTHSLTDHTTTHHLIMVLCRSTAGERLWVGLQLRGEVISLAVEPRRMDGGRGGVDECVGAESVC